MQLPAGCCRLASIALAAVSALASANGLANADRSKAAAIVALGVPFIPNLGQTDRDVAFLARTFAGTVFVTTDGRIVYSLPPAQAGSASGAARQGWALTESFPRRGIRPVGLAETSARVSDFVGGTNTRSDLATYERIDLGEIADGVTAELRAAGDNVEKLFTVRPGADATALLVKIAGTTKLALEPDGGLAVGTGNGDLRFTAPVAFQIEAGHQVPVAVAYRLTEKPGEYGFAVGAYDRTKPLVIDPLIRSTYSGGNGTDSIRAMLVHPGSGQVYVAGSTTSTNFPGTSGGAVELSSPRGAIDAFIARYSPSLTSLPLRTAYYGGGSDDFATAISIYTSTGDIYMAGRTSSSSGLAGIGNTYNLGAPGALGVSDAFIVRFNGALEQVLGSAMYFGGSAADGASGLAVDRTTGEVVMVGDTHSTNLPVVGPQGQVSGWQPKTGGGQDGFVARFTPDLVLIRASHLGGTGEDRALAVAIDPLGSDVVVGGGTQSIDFPKAANGAFDTNGGSNDGFVARFDSSLVNLRQSTYIGGTGSDEVTALAIHPASLHVYATGDTSSTDFRGRLVGQTNNGGGFDAFVVRLYPELTGMQAATYYGGTGIDSGRALAINPASGEVYIAGYTSSTTIPGVALGIQTSNPGSDDAFVARFDAGLNAVRQATLLGSMSADAAYAMAISDTTVFIAGETSTTTNFPGISPAAAASGAADGFISAMHTDLRAEASNPAAFTFKPIAGVLPLTLQTSAPTRITPTGPAAVYVDGQPGSSWCASINSGCSCNLTGNVFTTDMVFLTATQPYFVCVRQMSSAAPNAISEATLHVGAMAGTFRVGTGLVPGLGCTLDADGNGVHSALTDGLVIIRALFGLTGSAVTTGAIASNPPPTRSTWADISAFFNANCGTNFQP